jgi:hypothetical protein
MDSHKNITNIVDHFIPGVQSVGLDNSLPLFEIKDIGKSQTFQDLYSRPEHSITIERILSNLDKLWLEKSSQNFWSRTVTDNREYWSAMGQADPYKKSFLLRPENFGLSINGFDDGQKSTRQQYILPEYTIRLVYTSENSSVIGSSGLSGNALDIVELPYCLLKSLAYSFGTDGPFTETIELSGKVLDRKSTTSYNFDTRGGDENATDSTFVKTLKRESFDKSLSVLPSTINALTDFNQFKDGQEILGITGIEISVSFDYSNFMDNGAWRGSNSSKHEQLNMFTALSLPLQISCRFTVTARRSQQIDIKQSDVNFTNEQICIVSKIKNYEDDRWRFFIFNLGDKNKLASISESGGDASGSIVEYTIEYINNKNDFVSYTQLQPNADPLVLNPPIPTTPITDRY